MTDPQAVKVGDTVELGELDGKPYTVEVKAACEKKHDGYWFCATHNIGFANQLQKDIHIHEGSHRLGWMCHTHGLEQP